MTQFIVQFINLLASMLWLAMLGRVVISWLNLSPQNPLVVVLYQVTEPILAPIRRALPRMGSFDLSPMIALLLITLVQRVLNAVLRA